MRVSADGAPTSRESLDAGTTELPYFGDIACRMSAAVGRLL